MAQQKSEYQKTHRPVAKTEIKCRGRVENGACVKCGRYLKRNGAHLPNQYGACGFIFHYADGSVFNDEPTLDRSLETLARAATKVYAFDVSEQGETKVLTFTNSAQPTEEEFKTDVHKALHAAREIEVGWHVLAVKALEALGYVRVGVVTYDAANDEVFIDE